VGRYGPLGAIGGCYDLDIKYLSKDHVPKAWPLAYGALAGGGTFRR
jgi:hypothetical protein